MSDDQPVVPSPTPAPEAVSGEPLPNSLPKMSETAVKAEEAKAVEKADKKAKEQIKKLYKAIVDGKQVEVTEDELIKGFQKSSASQKRFEEGAKLKKQAEQLYEFMKTMPEKALKEAGHDPMKFAEELLFKKIEEEKLSPQDRRIRELESLLKDREEKDLKSKQEHELAEFERLTQHYETELESQIVDTLATSGLPKTDFTVKRVAHYLNIALDNGYNNVTPADVMDYVKNDFEKNVNQYMNSYDVDTLLKRLPKSILDKIREANIAGVKKAPESPLKTMEVPKVEKTGETKKRDKKSIFDFRTEMNKIINDKS